MFYSGFAIRNVLDSLPFKHNSPLRDTSLLDTILKSQAKNLYWGVYHSTCHILITQTKKSVMGVSFRHVPQSTLVPTHNKSGLYVYAWWVFGNAR